MGGFNYGGNGDGTSWSSERGNGPEPGGGDRGHSGDHDTGGTSKNNASQQQLSAIQSDPVVRDKLTNLIRAARIINPVAVIKIESLSASGTLSISVTGITVDQASTLGLSGLLVGFKYDGGNIVLGDIETNIKVTGSVRQENKTAAFNNILSKANDVVTPKVVPPRTVWERAGDYYGSSTPVSNFSRKRLVSAYNRTIAAGGVLQGSVNIRINVQKMLDEDKRIADKKSAAEVEKKASEEDVLLKTSEIIADLGAKISENLGDKYKSVADEITSNIKNFQGKTIRNFNDAMTSLNKVIANPEMKINQADKEALINAWKQVNAQDMASKLGNLSRGFKVVDLVMKIEKVREKSIVGYETGNWGPLVLEVESWVLSGMASAIALGLFSATLGSALVFAGLSAMAVTIIGIVIASLVGAMIDDSIVEKLNNEIIRAAH